MPSHDKQNEVHFTPQYFLSASGEAQIKAAFAHVYQPKQKIKIPYRWTFWFIAAVIALLIGIVIIALQYL